MARHYANGKICYVEMPAHDIRQSARPASEYPGLLLYIIVDSVAEAIESVRARRAADRSRRA